MIHWHEAKYISQKFSGGLHFTKNGSIPESIETESGSYMFYFRKSTNQLFVYDKNLRVVEEVYI